ncbi:apolipo protein O-domain-containing protein, partial [Amylocystis lapponica]
QLPIYPAPEPEILLLETPSELEKQIRVARRAVTATYLDAHARVQHVVSRWIGVEQAVEHRLKSLVAPDEPLTPGILYVGVATLTGSVLARNRGLALRLLLPPALLALSLRQFLPKTAHNVAGYLGALEDHYAPGLAQKHEVAKAHSAMTVDRVKDATQSGREAVTAGVVGAVARLEQATGLKFREALGLGHREDRSTQVVHAAEHQTSALTETDVVQEFADAKADDAST